MNDDIKTLWGVDPCLFCKGPVYQEQKDRLAVFPAYYKESAHILQPEDVYSESSPLYFMNKGIEDKYNYCNFFGSIMHLGCWRIVSQELCDLLYERYQKKDNEDHHYMSPQDMADHIISISGVAEELMGPIKKKNE